jgi:uncharacterized protein YndB with AHSA1/START domain
MWKWLGGCLLVIVVLVAGAVIWGYRTMKESLGPDGSASVMIAATPARVFASIANGDSAATWMAQGSVVLPSRHGPLMKGDTLRIESRTPVAAQEAMIWTVTDLVPDQLLAMELRSRKSGGIFATRVATIAAVGDSTRVETIVASPMVDSTKAAGSKPGAKSSGGFNEVAPDLMLSMFRMQAKLELLRLKARIEGSGSPAAKR